MLADTIFAYYDAELCELVSRLKSANPALLAKIRQDAFAARIVAVLHAIERHAAALAGQVDPQIDIDFIVRYRRHVTDYHGKLEPPDFDRRRRVPIADIYVAPNIVQVVEADPAQPPREIDLWILAEEVDRTVLLGDPGSGKSSAAHVLMDHYGRAAFGRLPFMVTLREFASEYPPARSIIGHIENKLETFYQCPAPPGLVERSLLNGSGMVIFDGLDELVDTARRADVTAIIEQFGSEYPLARILITSRVVGYDEARLDERQFVHYRIAGFDEERTANYVVKWFCQEEGLETAESHDRADTFMTESAQVSDLRSNPLMLALMCILYRGEGSIPRNRPEVYEQCSSLLFRRWDARRHIHVALRARHLVEPALRHLAFWLFTRGESQAAVTEQELIQETAQFLCNRGLESQAEAEDASREFVGFCRGRAWVFSDMGTTATGKSLYTFTHRTFLEYFAAAHLSASCDTPEKLARSILPHVAREEWEIVADLATQIKDRASDRGGERIVAIMLTERRYRSVQSRSHILAFLARALAFVDLPPRSVRDLCQDILDHALSGDTDDKIRCDPLHHLLTACSGLREIVKEEISARISALVASTDPVDVSKGLRLAVWLDDKNIPNQTNRVRDWDPELWTFWNDYSNVNMNRYSATIIEVAERDSVLRYTALVRGLISSEQILTDARPDLKMLFNMQPTFFGIVGPPHLFRHVYDLLHDRAGSRHMDPVEDFRAFGKFAIEHPDLPFVTNPTSYGNFLGKLSPRRGNTLPDEITYLGAALAFTIGAEADRNIALRREDRHNLGPFNDLYSYVARRFEIERDAELSRLPVPEPFPELFRSWANKEVDFMAWA
jgi:hypothetical protein